MRRILNNGLIQFFAGLFFSTLLIYKAAAADHFPAQLFEGLWAGIIGLASIIIGLTRIDHGSGGFELIPEPEQCYDCLNRDITIKALNADNKELSTALAELKI